MQDKKNSGDSRAKNWFNGVKAEFHKIVWTSREELTKQTVTVVAVTAVLCVIISIMDAGILRCINFLMK